MFKRALTFDDLALVPQYNNITSRLEPDLSTWLTKDIKIGMPLIPANMDCVIGDELADVIIERGGMPFFHRFSNIETQKGWIEKYQDKAFYSVGLDWAHLDTLVQQGAKNLVFDIAHGHSNLMLNQISRCKSTYPEVTIIAGNICTAQGYVDLVNAGADAVKAGCGSGAACSTRATTGFGVPQFTAIYDCAQQAKKYKIPIIADGGIRNSRDVAIALAAGACSVMVGKLFALTYESSAKKIEKHKLEIGESGGWSTTITKCYRGQASLDFQNELRGGLKKGTVPEGEHFWAPVTKSANEVIDELLGGLRSAMTYGGARTIQELQRKAEFVEVNPNSYGLESSIRKD
jgi:IMP dehydrogenase